MLLGENESWSLWGLGSLDCKDISMWGGGGHGGRTRYSARVRVRVELVKVMRIIAFLFGIRLIYKKLLRKEVFYIIYSTLITY